MPAFSKKKLKQNLKNLFVQADEDKNLDLSYSELSKIPGAVYRQDGLLSLNLAGNQITNMPALTKLDLSGNKLTTLPQSFSQNLSESLVHLDLSYNTISVFPYACLYQLRKMKTLNVSNNGLHSIPDGLHALGQLELLDVSHNNLQHFSADLCRLQHLKELKLAHNELSSLPNSSHDMPTLVKLDLSHNRFTEIPAILTRSTRLQTFDLSYNNLNALDPMIIEAIPETLKTLNLSFNKDLTTVPKELARINNAQIDLRDCGLVDIPPEVHQMLNIRVDWARIAYLMRKKNTEEGTKI